HDPADVDLVRRGAGAAEDDLVELLGREGLAHQQRAARRGGEVGGGKGARGVFRLQEGRACAIDDIDGPAHSATSTLFWAVSWAGECPCSLRITDLRPMS